MKAAQQQKPLEAANDPCSPKPPNPEELATLAAATDLAQVASMPLFDIQAARAARYLSTPPAPTKWLVQGVIPSGIVCALIAPGGTGKSMFALQLGAAIATGQAFANVWEVRNSAPVLLLMAEDADEELHRRLWNIAEQMHIPQGERLDNLYIKSLVGEDVLLTTESRDGGGVKSTPTLSRLIHTAAQIEGLGLIVIDPISRWRGGDENSAPDTTRFIQAAEQVAKATGAAVMLVHHTHKGAANSGEASQSAARGSSALTDGVRLQMQLATVNGNMNKKLKLPEDQMRQHLVLSVTKTNYSAPQAEILLQRGEGGYLSKAEAPATIKSLSHADADILRLLREDAEKGTAHTQRSFCKAYAGMDKPLKTSDHGLRKRLAALIEAGKIIKTGHRLSA